MSSRGSKRITFLDGGMGHLIKQWGVVIPDLPYEQQFLAGCLALQAAPDTVVRAHAAYISAGCDVITTNSFVATMHNLAKVDRAGEQLQLCQVGGWGGGGVGLTRIEGVRRSAGWC
jgi:methionine synthase I (cobalamin-dependent)